MGESQWEKRKAGREDLTRVIVEHERKKGNYSYTQRQAEDYASRRADICDKKRDWK